jgi:hypothetical protein
MTIAKFINSTLIWLTFIAASLQFIIDFSTVNIAATCVVFSASIMVLLYFRWTKALETHPLSSFALFGFCVTSQLGALLAQSFSWLSLSDNLRQPLLTFFMLAMYQIIALSAHLLYRMLTEVPPNKQNKSGLIRNALGKLGIYTTPSVIQIWIMAGIGIFSLLLARISPVANGLSFLAWTPFLIPIYLQQVGTKYCNAKLNYLLLVAYFGLVVLMALAFNARSTMLAGVATVLFLFLLIGMRSHKLVTMPMLLKFSMVALLGVVLSWPASNMVTAMVIAREDRYKVSLSKMVTNTIDNFFNLEKLAEYKKDGLAKSLRAYDETYIENPMVARFVITKFHDNALYFAGKISDKNAVEVAKLTKDFFWAMLPQPWLDTLKIDVNKNTLYFSMGDVLTYYATGTPLGGLKTGSVFGQGAVLFGYFFPVIYFFMCLVLFAAIDLFATRTAAGVAVLSVIGMINVWPNFLFGIIAESLHHLLNSAVRGVVQVVILYAIVFAIARLLSGMYLKLLGTKTITSLGLKVEQE